MLQTLGSHPPFASDEPAFGSDHGLDFNHFLDIFKRNFFLFLFTFGLVAVLGMLFAAIQKPNYASEGKILLEAQFLAPDIVKPVSAMTALERVQLIQQRVITRDNLIALAQKFQLFPDSADVVGPMRDAVQFKPAVADAQMRTSALTVAFTVGFQYSDPKVAMAVANELVNMIVSEDDRARRNRAGEAVKLLSDDVKDLESKLENTQAQIFEAARRPPDVLPTMSEQQRAQLSALATLRAELAQKMSVYSDAHPTVTSLKKRIALMEKSIQEPAPSQAQSKSGQIEDTEALKRQREAIEKRLSEANAKLSTARLSEKMDQGQQADRLQVIEAPTVPERPVKSNRLKIVAIAFAAALALGVGSALAAEFLNGSIHGPEALAGMVPASLTVSIPYIETRGDIVRARARLAFAIVCVLILLTVLVGLAAAIVLHLPIEPSSAWSEYTRSSTIGSFWLTDGRRH